MKRFYITGVAGTGKSTIGRMLQAEGAAAFDIEDIPGLCMWQNKETGELTDRNDIGDRDAAFLAAHDWVCDAKALESHMGSYAKSPVIAVGVAVNQKEYLHLFDQVFLLQCSDDVIVQRLKTRNTNDFGKTEAEQESVLGWRPYFEKALLERGAIAVPNDLGSVKTVKRLLEFL